jgi:hypothetical protein
MDEKLLLTVMLFYSMRGTQKNAVIQLCIDPVYSDHLKSTACNIGFRRDSVILSGIYLNSNGSIKWLKQCRPETKKAA